MVDVGVEVLGLEVGDVGVREINPEVVWGREAIMAGGIREAKARLRLTSVWGWPKFVLMS